VCATVHCTVHNCCAQYCTEQTWSFSLLPSRQSPLLRLRTIAQLCRVISSQLRNVSTIKKKLVKQQYLLHNMVNFGPLMAEICCRVWGTPANFNGFRVLAALLHGTLVVGISQTVALNRGRHLYSAGQPSRWALAHILVTYQMLSLAVYPTVKKINELLTVTTK